jgi:hypothetical protein
MIELAEGSARYSHAGHLEFASEGANPAPMHGMWYYPEGIIQGEIVTRAAGSRDLYITEAESVIFAELQALGAEATFDFWNDTREDIYEDLSKA